MSPSDYYYNTRAHTHTMASSCTAFSATLPNLHLRQPYLSSPALLRHSPLFCSVRPITLSSSSIIGERFQCRSKASSSSSTAEMANEKSQGKNVKVFDSEEDLAVALAKYTADLSDKFTKERGSFTVVVSGGSLIKSLRSLFITSLNVILLTFH